MENHWQCPIFSTKLSKYRVTCFKLARELANCSKLKPVISDLSQDLLKRVFSHHRHDIDKVVAQCLLRGGSTYGQNQHRPPFWLINHANSAYFRLFLGYFHAISTTWPPFWISAPPPFLHILDPPLLLAGNYLSWSHRQNDMGVGPLKIEMDPLKLVFYTFKGSKRPLLFGTQC